MREKGTLVCWATFRSRRQQGRIRRGGKEIGSQDSFSHRGDMPAGSTDAVKNQIKGKGVMPGSPAAVMETWQFFYGWERKMLFVLQPAGEAMRRDPAVCVYGIYQFGNRYVKGACDRHRLRSCRVGRHQSSGGLRKRQPRRKCSCTVKKQATENKR